MRVRHSWASSNLSVLLGKLHRSRTSRAMCGGEICSWMWEGPHCNKELRESRSIADSQMMYSQRVMQVFSLLCPNQISLTLVFRGGWVLLCPGSNQATSPVPQAPCPVRKKENMRIDLITLIPKHNYVLVVFLNSPDFICRPWNGHRNNCLVAWDFCPTPSCSWSVSKKHRKVYISHKLVGLVAQVSL